MYSPHLVTQDSWPSVGAAFDGPSRVGTLIDANGGPPLHDAVLAVEAGKTLLFDKEDLVRKADKQGLHIIAV